MKPLVSLLIFFAGFSIAEDATTKAKETQEPQITVEMNNAYHWAYADLLKAQQDVKDAQARLDKAVADINATCGARPIINDTKIGFACGVKPTPETNKDNK